MQVFVNKIAENNPIRGIVINEIFKKSEKIAKLHQTLTSTRGDYFRLSLLTALRKKMSIESIDKTKEKVSLKECERHLDKLLEFGLIECIKVKNKNYYVRTKTGERALNNIKALERNIGESAARKIYRHNLGINSIRLFLKVYGQNKKPSFFGSFMNKKRKLQVIYRPHEIGRIALFLPRTIEGISAIDKLNLGGLLVYEDDGCIHMPPIKARAFYVYLKNLYGIVSKA